MYFKIKQADETTQVDKKASSKLEVDVKDNRITDVKSDKEEKKQEEKDKKDKDDKRK